MTRDRPIRVLHLANSLSDRGNGIVNVAVDLAIEQATRGHVVAFASGGGGYAPMLEAAGVQCSLAPQVGAASALRNSIALLKLLRRFRPDIIHTHMRNGFVLVLPWARILRKPVVMHVHNIHDRDYGLTRRPERVIAVSQSVRDTLVRQGTPAGRVRVVLNGTLGSHRQKTDHRSVPLIRPAIVTVAGMMHRKGIAELIAAFDSIAPKHPSTHLYLVGAGSELENFMAQAGQSLTNNRIHFEGFQADPRPYLRSADLFVLASRRESFGLAIIEAREAGCAIIASDIDGIPELLEGGRCGVLTPPNNSQALARQIDRLLDDAHLRHELGRAAQSGLERFTVSKMTDDVLSVYAEVLRR